MVRVRSCRAFDRHEALNARRGQEIPKSLQAGLLGIPNGFMKAPEAGAGGAQAREESPAVS